MKNQTQYVETAQLSKSQDTLILKLKDEFTILVNANLIRYALGVAYTRKDGTKVTEAEISKMKNSAKEKYIKAIKENQTSQARSA